MKAAPGLPFVVAVSLDPAMVPSFDAYPFCIPAIRQLGRLKFHPSVTFLVGENGSGKSTLLEALAVRLGFSAEGGSRDFRFSTKDTHSSLHEALVVDRGGIPRRPSDNYFLRAESFYNVATEAESLGVLRGYGGKGLHDQSHGESFLNTVTHRLRGDGLYLLDEPEAALSPQRQLSFLVRLHELVQTGSQLIIATHSPIIMAYPNARIVLLSERGAEDVAYEDTEHFQVTRDFLSRREKMLHVLLADDEG